MVYKFWVCQRRESKQSLKTKPHPRNDCVRVDIVFKILIENPVSQATLSFIPKQPGLTHSRVCLYRTRGKLTVDLSGLDLTAVSSLLQLSKMFHIKLFCFTYLKVSDTQTDTQSCGVEWPLKHTEVGRHAGIWQVTTLHWVGNLPRRWLGKEKSREKRMKVLERKRAGFSHGCLQISYVCLAMSVCPARQRKPSFLWHIFFSTFKTPKNFLSFFFFLQSFMCHIL